MNRPVTLSGIVLFVLVLLGLAGLSLAACVDQPAPTPDVEQLAQALARTWATQTAQAASAAGPATETAPPGGETVPPAPPTASPTGATVLPPPLTASPTATPSPSGAPPASPTPTLTPTPSVTPTPGCRVPVDAELAAMWDQTELGCPGMWATVIPAKWQEFEHGSLLWDGSHDRTYALGFADGSDSWQGLVIAADPSWRWDGISFPNGRGLTPPPGLFEPMGSFGSFWFERLGGQAGQLGWATAPAREICLTMQPSAAGLVAKTSPSPCAGVQNPSSETIFLALQNQGTWRRRPEARPPTPTPTSPPPCSIAADARLEPAWERSKLGCPVSPVAVIWAAWQPFEHGNMLWRSDNDWIYELAFAGGTDADRGAWATGGESWRWDGSFPDGRGLTPPAGKTEPIRGFGFVWYGKRGGPTGPLGWATAPERGFCVTLQVFDAGLIFASNPEVESCQDGGFNMARDPAFTPIRMVLRGDGSWQRR